MNLFTYGTLQFQEVMKILLGKSIEYEDLSIKGFKRRRLKGEVFPAVINSDSERVSGRVYFGITEEDFLILNKFEGDYYSPVTINIETKRIGKTLAIIYVLREEFFSFFSSEEWEVNHFSKTHLDAYLSSIKENFT